ncbi:MAG: MBL fold metallo-hydrolase [bacterium]
MKRNWAYYGVGLILGFLLLVVSQIPSEKARLLACDVGQGDAILIIKGKIQVLVDGGPSGEKILACLAEQIPFFDRTIELIVLTNTDFDHMNGLSSVLERYNVIQFVTADGVHESAALTRFADEISNSGVKVSGVERGDEIRVGAGEKSEELIFEVLWPSEVKREYLAVFSNQIETSKREQILGASAKAGDLNERSVVLLLVEDGYKTLLMGDAGDQAEKELLKLGGLPDVDYLKVGHHGSKYASSLEFLQVVKPEVAVISVGAKNTYGHPTKETLERLQEVGAEVHRTDQEGTIEIEE